MKKMLIPFLVAMFMGYVWGNFSTVSADFVPNSYGYHSRSHGYGDSEMDYETRGLNYRGRNSSYDDASGHDHTMLEYRGRDSDSTLNYKSRDDNDPDETTLEYRGRSSRTGRYMRR